MTSWIRCPLGVTTVFVIAMCWLGLTAKSGAAVECGDEITKNTTLHHDLLDCPGDGLIIDADNVTLQLNGYMIEGSFGSVGVKIDGKSRTKVLGPGVIRQFGTGVEVRSQRLPTSVRNRVSRINLIDNCFGIEVFGDPRNTLIDGNTITTANQGGCGLGIINEGGFDDVTESTAIVDNRLTNGPMRIKSSSYSNIRSNYLSAIEMYYYVRSNLINNNLIAGGMYMDEGADDNIVSNNIANGTINVGGTGAKRNQIYLNIVESAATGIYIDRQVDAIGDNVVKANRLFDNQDQIHDDGVGTIVRANFCDPPDDEPPCSTQFQLGKVIDSDIDSVLDGDDRCRDTDFRASVVINGIDTNIANVLTGAAGCTMMDRINDAALVAGHRAQFIAAISRLTRNWVDHDLIDQEDAAIIRRAAASRR